MQEYRGYGSTIIIDGKNISINCLLLKENCLLTDIKSVEFRKPSFLKNGCLTITTRKNKYEVHFLKKRLDEFTEIYELLNEWSAEFCS
ncbi:MAG: hypothetical protein K0R18_1685 [Bacillales bacterium]|jgi:hypothetical protein|nr:hypothetical protein [Bacillales bacterium]